MSREAPGREDVLATIAMDRCRAISPFVLAVVLTSLIASESLGIPLSTPVYAWNVVGMIALSVIVVGSRRRWFAPRWAHVAIAIVWLEAVGGTLFSLYYARSSDLALVILIEVLGLAIMLDSRIVLALLAGLDLTALPLILRTGAKSTPILLITIGCAQIFAVLLHAMQRRAFLQLALSRDAERRAAEEQQRLRDQLVHAQRMDAIGTLASGLAHDMNNVLASITSLAELVREQPSSPTSRDDLTRLLAQAGRGAALTRGLLAFSRRAGMKKRVIHVTDLVGETVALLSRTLPKHVEIDAALAGGDLRVEGDFGQLQQVIVNLGVNAADAMPADSHARLAISTRTVRIGDDTTVVGLSPGEYVELTIADTGCGMDAETRKRAFEPFFTTKPLGKGTGLGLSTAWGIAQSHGGTLTVDSVPGVGTTFHVYLPTTQKSSRPIGRTEDKPAMAETATVLVVDDEDVVRQSTMRLLARRGLHAIGASNGEEALALYRQHADAISLVILDMGMPVMGGRECFQRLRLISQVPVLVATGYALEEEAQQLLAHGVTLLEKPFTSERLMREVSRLLQVSVTAAKAS